MDDATAPEVILSADRFTGRHTGQNPRTPDPVFREWLERQREAVLRDRVRRATASPARAAVDAHDRAAASGAYLDILEITLP